MDLGEAALLTSEHTQPLALVQAVEADSPVIVTRGQHRQAGTHREAAEDAGLATALWETYRNQADIHFRIQN